MPTQRDPLPALTLEQLLSRQDIWRGEDSHTSNRASVATGHSDLDALLLHGGWPLGALIEICQQRFQGEWQLFLAALLSLQKGLLVLLNPPAEPFSQALIQAGVDLDRLVIVNAARKDPFIGCFRELARTRSCAGLLAWQPPEYFTYTELRKCLLAAADGQGLYTLFRPAPMQQQSSPAQLRIFSQVIPSGLEVTVFKQKGILQKHQPRPVVLPLPSQWQPALSHAELDRSTERPVSRDAGRAPVVPLRGSQ